MTHVRTHSSVLSRADELLGPLRWPAVSGFLCELAESRGPLS